MVENNNTGKLLEEFVKTLEKVVGGETCTVSSNHRVFNDDGVQVAEFDIIVTGTIGTTAVNVLIECRDRPSEGAAPGSWIEQLVGRQSRFGFNKVIAVSTTGFSPGAVEAAGETIELRTLNDIDLSEVATWFATTSFKVVRNSIKLRGARLNIDPTESAARRDAMLEVLEGPDDLVLEAADTGENVPIHEAFAFALNAESEILNRSLPGQPRSVRLIANYRGDSYFVVQTSAGPIRIQSIQFDGEISTTVEHVPLSAAKYRNETTGETIATKASGELILGQQPVELSFQRLAESGKTFVNITNLNITSTDHVLNITEDE